MTATKIFDKPVLDPATTTILVVGATGFIAGNIIREALDLGYSVRGTTRDQEKADKTKAIHNTPRYTTAIVPDFRESSPEVNAAVKGVDAICFVATDLTYGTDVEGIVNGVVKGITNFCKAAAKEPSVKRFVLTSASAAAVTPYPNTPITVTAKSYNEEAVDAAWNKRDQPLGPNVYPWVVYAASKTQGEQAFWKFIEEEKPSFVGNTVLPNVNIGRRVAKITFTSQIIEHTYKSGLRDLFPPQYYIDVIDDARLHVAAAVLDSSIENERIFAMGSRFTWNEIVATVKKVRPEMTANSEPIEGQGEDMCTVPNERGAELLRKWYGQEGYKVLETSVREALEDVE